ncbi:MAG: hypothetical protein ACHP7F_10210 [Actinomycetales bacterium]
MPFRVFVDANVLVRGRWRDIVLTLAEAGVCDVLWSPLVLDEVERHLPDAMTAQDRVHLFAQMNSAFAEASVSWPGAVDLNVRLQINEKDRHVIAASLWGKADILLTDDQALHDEVIVSKLLDAQRMPVFLAYAIDSDHAIAMTALIEMARHRWLRSPIATDEEVLDRLRAYFERHGWPTDVLILGS